MKQTSFGSSWEPNSLVLNRFCLVEMLRNGTEQNPFPVGAKGVKVGFGDPPVSRKQRPALPVRFFFNCYNVGNHNVTLSK